MKYSILFPQLKLCTQFSFSNGWGADKESVDRSGVYTCIFDFFVVVRRPKKPDRRKHTTSALYVY